MLHEILSKGEKKCWASKIAPQIKARSHKADNLSLIPQNPHSGRRELIPTSFHLIYKHVRLQRLARAERQEVGQQRQRQDSRSREKGRGWRAEAGRILPCCDTSSAQDPQRARPELGKISRQEAEVPTPFSRTTALGDGARCSLPLEATYISCQVSRRLVVKAQSNKPPG